MTVERRDLTTIAALEPTLDRAKAANEYVEDRMHAVRLAQQIRDHAIGQAIAEHGVTATARAVGMSVSHVKKCRDAKAPSSPDDDGDDPPPTRAPKKSSEIEKLGDTSLPASLSTSKTTKESLQSCGTWAAYKRHRKAGEAACAACLAAGRARARRYYEANGDEVRRRQKLRPRRKSRKIPRQIHSVVCRFCSAPFATTAASRLYCSVVCRNRVRLSRRAECRRRSSRVSD